MEYIEGWNRRLLEQLQLEYIEGWNRRLLEQQQLEYMEGWSRRLLEQLNCLQERCHQGGWNIDNDHETSFNNNGGDETSTAPNEEETLNRPGTPTIPTSGVPLEETPNSRFSSATAVGYASTGSRWVFGANDVRYEPELRWRKTENVTWVCE